MKNLTTSLLLLILFFEFSLGQSITLQPGASTGKDSRVFNMACGINPGLGCDTSNYGTDGFFQANAWTFSGNSAICRSFIEFNLSTVTLNPSAINSAYLSLYFPPDQLTYESHSSISGSNSVNIDRVTQSWGESTIKWINQPATVSSNLTNLQNRVVIPATTSNDQNFTIDITEMLKYWISNPSQNFGMRLSLATEQYYRRMTFATSDHSNPSLHPKLVINYTGTNGISEVSNKHSSLNYEFSEGSVKINTINFGKKCSFVLSSLDGKVLQSSCFENESTFYSVNISNIPTGFYLIKLTDEKGLSSFNKIVLN